MNFSKSINVSGRLLSFDHPRVMGVINVAKDSFYAKSRVVNEDDILNRADKMLAEGADILDIGGYSSRPEAKEVPIKEEIALTSNAIELIKFRFPDALISIDTFRSEVAEVALRAGAAIVNDISAGTLDNKMIDFITANQVPYIAMHMRGNPGNMQKFTKYTDIIPEILFYFSELIERLRDKGHTDLIIDPGFGFAKTREQNFQILGNLEFFKNLESIILVGLSRKSMIYKTLNKNPSEVLNGTTVLNTIALSKGADILRVHDVLPAVEAIKLTTKTLN
ncbi:MAG: dihydropteroate synthase [Flammeovirgaceae bacterium]|nr:dihydropteroate synthase [Flammeovirgaceae bacterium]|tara:strand:+ start:29 stop:865 length:837 start_codon:yes stop_codon:yes gene_type:complete